MSIPHVMKSVMTALAGVGMVMALGAVVGPVDGPGVYAADDTVPVQEDRGSEP
jgi:hypothetical protein